MSENNRHTPGTFCWPELSTTDQEASKRFYTSLFGWEFIDHSMGHMGTYTMFTLGGKELGAASTMDAQRQAQGVPPHWLSYVSTDSAEATTTKAKSLGGNVMMGPFDVMDAGRMSVIADPTGAIFAIWEGGKHRGANVLDQPGALVWTELATRDEKVAGDFYSKLFDWKTEVMEGNGMKYTVFKRGDAPAAGMMNLQPEWGKMPPFWNVYFGVNDVDASASKAASLGGKEIVPPSDIPNVGRFAIIQDPQGAGFGIIKFMPRQA